MEAGQKRLVLSACILAALLGAAGLTGWTRYQKPQPHASSASRTSEAESHTYYSVEVDGVFIGYVDQPALADQALDNALSQVPKEALAYVDLQSRMRTTPVAMKARAYTIKGPQLIVEELLALVPELQRAWAIIVDGQEVVAVANRADGDGAIQELKNDYLQTILKSGASVEQIQFLESIGLREVWALPTEVRTKEQAKEVLRFGTDKRILYTVQRGDTLWGIATSRGVSVEELVKANPGINPDLLQPGQEVSVTFKEPYVHLTSSEVTEFTERIPFPEEWSEDPNLWPWQTRVIQPGVYGQKKVTMRIFRQDGRVVSREIVSTEIQSEPRKQVAVRGTRMAPHLGSGELYWPAQGTLSSKFGPRWGSLHAGIDIAAARGTPIHAADNGTVTYAGRYGEYGNCIMIDHGGGKMVTLYGHLSRIDVKLGQQVSKGQVIGAVGNTGHSTGPHVHFEVRISGKPTNPLKFYP